MGAGSFKYLVVTGEIPLEDSPPEASGKKHWDGVSLVLLPWRFRPRAFRRSGYCPNKRRRNE